MTTTIDPCLELFLAHTFIAHGQPGPKACATLTNNNMHVSVQRLLRYEHAHASLTDRTLMWGESLVKFPSGFCIAYSAAGRLIASSPEHAKNRGAPGTHCLSMRLISPRCEDSGLFSDSSALCDVRVWIRYSILVRII